MRSSSFFLTSPDRVAIIVAGPASPARSVGGLKRGAPRLRSARRLSFHRAPASPARSVGGLKRGAPRLRSARRVSLDAPAEPRQPRQREGERVGHVRGRRKPPEPEEPADRALHLLLRGGAVGRDGA